MDVLEKCDAGTWVFAEEHYRELPVGTILRAEYGITQVFVRDESRHLSDHLDGCGYIGTWTGEHILSAGDMADRGPHKIIHMGQEG